MYIIDNKKIDLTSDEYKMYQQICRSYDRPNFKGEDLFKDLFESDDDGNIMFLRPPSKSYTSMEVFMFMIYVFAHQHVRLMGRDLEEFKKDLRKELLDEVKKSK